MHFVPLVADGLIERHDTLKEIDLGNSLIEPADVDRLRSELPGTQIKWDGLGSAGKIFSDSGWQKGKAEKWIPKELLERAVAASQSHPEPAK